MKKTLFASVILFLLTVVGCNSSVEVAPEQPQETHTTTRSANVSIDPDDYTGNIDFEDQVYTIAEIQSLVHDQLGGIDPVFAHEILSCTPTAIPTSQVLPSAIRLAYAYHMSETADPQFISHLAKFAPTCLYLFTPSCGGYVLANADKRGRDKMIVYSNQSFPTDFFDHYRHYALACESHLPNIYGAVMQNDSIELDEEVDKQLIPKLLLDGIDFLDEQKKMRTLTHCIFKWWERPDIYPPYISWKDSCSIDTMEMGWTQEYPYNQFFQDNGVTGSVPLCIAKLLVYEEIDATIGDFYFSGSVYRSRQMLNDLYHNLPSIARLINSEMRDQLYRYSPTYMGISFLRNNGFQVNSINRSLPTTDKYYLIREQIRDKNHPVIAVDGSDWVLIVGISYCNQGGDQYMLKIDENGIATGDNTWHAYDISDMRLYTYKVDSDMEIH